MLNNVNIDNLIAKSLLNKQPLATSSGTEQAIAKVENPLAKIGLKKGKTTIMIGLDDQSKKRETVLLINLDNITYFDNKGDNKIIDKYKYNFKKNTLTKNKQPITDQPGSQIQKIISAFQKRNKNIKVFERKTK
jgi:hypothetical protein